MMLVDQVCGWRTSRQNLAPWSLLPPASHSLWLWYRCFPFCVASILNLGHFKNSVAGIWPNVVLRSFSDRAIILWCSWPKLEAQIVPTSRVVWIQKCSDTENMPMKLGARRRRLWVIWYIASKWLLKLHLKGRVSTITFFTVHDLTAMGHWNFSVKHLRTYNYVLKMRKLEASKPIIWELEAGNLKLANMFSLFSLFRWVTWIGAQVSHLPPSVWRNTDEVSKFHEHEPIPLTTFCVGGPRPYEQLQRTRTHSLPTTRCGALKVLSGPQPVDTSENQDWREPFHSILASWQSGE